METCVQVGAPSARDGVRNPNVLGRELHSHAILAGTRTRCSPVVAMGKPSLVGESSALECLAWNVREGGNGDVDVLGRAWLARVKLNGHPPDKGVWRASGLE